MTKKLCPVCDYSLPHDYHMNSVRDHIASHGGIEVFDAMQRAAHEPSDDFRSRITIERLKEMRRTQGDGGPVCTIRGNGVAVCCCCGARVTQYRQFIGYNLCDACLDASEPRSASTPPPPDALPKLVNHDLWRHMSEAHGLTLTQSEIDDILLLIPIVTSQAQSERQCEMEGLDETHDLSAGVICISCWNKLASRAAQPPEVDSRDSAAQVDQFAEAMKAKMHEKSMQGYGGWEEASAGHLARLLIEHVPKGDPVDIANFAMMLWHHKGGEEIRRACSPPFPDGERDIVEALDDRGDDLSVRAARYIRRKQHMLAGRESEIRHMAASHMAASTPPPPDAEAANVAANVAVTELLSSYDAIHQQHPTRKDIARFEAARANIIAASQSQPPSGDNYEFAGPPASPQSIIDALTIADLRKCLEFYAKGDHFILSEPGEWDTVSGEPQNFYCDAAGTATVEDGTLAQMALDGKQIQWGEDKQESLQLDGLTQTKSEVKP